jgi:hypothetical protein
MFPLNSIVLSLALTAYLLAYAGVAARVLMLIYGGFIFIDRSPARGGYKWANRAGLTRLLRGGFWWRWSSSYFPATMHRTKVLAPGTPYLFACHPHGIFGVSIQASLGTDSTGFNTLFPGIPVHLCGLKPIFLCPFFREWATAPPAETPYETCSGRKSQWRWRREVLTRASTPSLVR